MPRFGRGERSAGSQQAAYHNTTSQQGAAQRSFEDAMAQKAHDVDFVAFAQHQQLLRFAAEMRWQQQQKSYRNTKLTLMVLGPLAIISIILVGYLTMENWIGITVIVLVVALILATLWRSNETKKTTLAQTLAASGIANDRHTGLTGTTGSAPRRW